MTILTNNSASPLKQFWKHIFQKQTFFRIFVTLVTTALIAIIYAYKNYENYWFVTIFRTQTVDFNILANQLPTKLSLALVRNNLQEVHQTLDSNYGLFGLVVTDCKLKTVNCEDQKIVAYSNEGDLYKYKWAKNLTVASLKDSYFDVLLDPPPLTAEWGYQNSYSLKGEEELTGRKNSGKVIGRVYYVRGIPPSFLESFAHWTQDPTINSSSINYFTSIVILSLIIWAALTLIVEFAFLNSKLQSEKLEQEQERTRRIQELKDQAEAYSTRLQRFINIARNSLEQNFATELVNRAQEMRSILSCFESDIQNISHEAKHSYLDTASTTQQLLELTEIPKRICREEFYSLTRQMAKDVEGTLTSIQKVVKDLRQFAKIEGEEIDVTEQLKDLESSDEENFRKRNLHYIFDIPEYSILINCNPWRLRSIVRNIIYNANIALLKLYMKNKSFCPEVRIRCYKDQSKAYIEILDNGSGIQDESVLKKLYRSEESINQDKDGLNGNGSIIVQQYLELHNGKVEEVGNCPEGGLKVLISFNLL